MVSYAVSFLSDRCEIDERERKRERERQRDLMEPDIQQGRQAGQAGQAGRRCTSSTPAPRDRWYVIGFVEAPERSSLINTMLGLAHLNAWDQLEHARGSPVREPAQRIGFPGSYLVIVIGVVTATSTSAILIPAPVRLYEVAVSFTTETWTGCAHVA